MKASVNRLPGLQHGFSLVELMVGVTIALIAILVMQQSVVFFDGQKRGVSGGGDAQNTGMIAMYTLESDFRQAGYGLASLETLYCTMQTSQPFNGRPFIPAMIIPDGMPRTDAKNPLQIPPGDTGTDILVVMYGHTSSTPEGVPITATTSATKYSFGKNLTGFNVGDYIMAAQAGQPCTLAMITAIDTTTRQITVDHSSTGATYSANTTNVFNLGANGLTMRAYAVRNGNLTVCDAWANDCSADLSTMTASAINALWVPISSNVIGLRAQYGWDTSTTPDMRVETYCRSRLTTASPTCPATDDGMTSPATTPSTACDWTRIVTLRVALVARNAEKAASTTNVSDATITLWPNVSLISGTNVGPTTVGPVFPVPSRQYRYKTFQSTVPIRNVIWFGAQSSCT